VPFILYAPGLFDRGVRLAHVTSHVDIAPTLFDLVGISTDSLLLHGSSMMDPTLARRSTFMSNNSLRPVDGYYKDGWIYVYNSFSGEARAERAPGAMASLASPAVPPAPAASPALDATVAGTLDRAAGVFDTTAAYFLQRRAKLRTEMRSASRSSP